MRGEDERSEDLFSFVRLEQRVPADHPLRAIRALVDEALGQLSRSFARLYARDGRPSIPPERLLRAHATATRHRGAGGATGSATPAVFFMGAGGQQSPSPRDTPPTPRFFRKGRGRGPSLAKRGIFSG